MRKFYGKDKIEEIQKSKKISRTNKRRIAAFIASGLMTLSLNASTVRIENSEDSTMSHPYAIAEEIKNTDLSDWEKTQIEAYRKQLKEQFDSSNVKLDSMYINSVYINGTNIKVVLRDDSFVEGEILNLEIGRLNLENLHIILEDEENESSDITIKNIKIDKKSFFSKIKVKNEFKYFSNNLSDNYFINKKSFFDLSNAEHVWIGGGYVTEDEIDEICSSKRLKSLYITDRMFCCNS